VPNRINLDMDVLRTFVTAFQLGSFSKAAGRLGRSQSAVSTQLRKLEEQIGRPLVQKAGRGLALTHAGESLLSYASRILELNDDVVEALRGADLEGWVRLGLPQDIAEAWLPAVLGRFVRAHPKVRIEVRTERTIQMIERTVRGELDLALAWGDAEGRPHAERVADLPIAWIGRPEWAGVSNGDSSPFPLVAFDPPCAFRAAGIAALDEAGTPWRLAFTSASVAGLWAAAEAGLGVTVRTRIGMPTTLVVLDPHSAGLPALPTISLALHRAELQPTAAVARLAAILRETIAEQMVALNSND
jgi:DNA-binding transcriptional LysR family regulator